MITSEVEWNSRHAVTWICDLQDPGRRTGFPSQFLVGVDEEKGIVAMVSGDVGEATIRSFPGLDLISTLGGIQPRTVCGNLSHDGKLLATGCLNGVTRIRKLVDLTSNVVPRDEPLPLVVRDVAFSMDDRFLIEVSSSGDIQIRDVVTQTLQKTLSTGQSGAWSTSISPDGKWFAVGCVNGCTKIYSWADVTAVRTVIQQLTQPTPAAAVDLKGHDYAVIDSTGAARVYSSDDDRMLQSIPAPDGVTFCDLGSSYRAFDLRTPGSHECHQQCLVFERRKDAFWHLRTSPAKAAKFPSGTPPARSTVLQIEANQSFAGDFKSGGKFSSLTEATNCFSRSAVPCFSTQSDK